MDGESRREWTIVRYELSQKGVWDAFVETAKNSTLLFKRDFMDYHSDRFKDSSLLAYKNGKLKAVLPANRGRDGRLYSHQGLTYGGWVTAPSGLDGEDMLNLWDVWMGWCKAEGISAVIYKPLPYIYSSMPSQDDLYCLYRSEAKPIGVSLSSTIDLTSRSNINKLQRRHLKSLEGRDIEIRQLRGDITREEFSEFHDILKECLETRHNAKPVHTLEELKLLSSRFPDNIFLSVITLDGVVEGGIWVFDTETCRHCQYIASTPNGRAHSILTPLVVDLIADARKRGKRYFDFGISTEQGGEILNCGLNRFKTSFGAGGVVYESYIIDVEASAEKLKNSRRKQS